MAPRPSAPVKIVFDASPFLFKKDEEDFNRIIKAHGADGAHILAKLFPLKITYPHLVFDHFYTEEDHCQYFKNRFGIDPLAEDAGFDPEEERIPKGQTGAGRWTQSGTSESKTDPDHHEQQEIKTQEEAEAKLEKDSKERPSQAVKSEISELSDNLKTASFIDKKLPNGTAQAATISGQKQSEKRPLLPGFHDNIQNGVKKLDFKDPRMVKAWKFYQDKGYTPAQIAGILAQMYQESHLDDRASGDGRSAYGLIQWHGDRRKTFEKVMGKPFQNSTFEDQLAFAEKEVHTEVWRDKKAGITHRAWKELQDAKDDPKLAGAYLSRDLVRPGAQEKQMFERGKIAQEIYNQAMKPENQTILDIHVNRHELPPNATVNISPKDKETSMKSIK